MGLALIDLRDGRQIVSAIPNKIFRPAPRRSVQNLRPICGERPPLLLPPRVTGLS
jgi:hypothetical protein